MNLIRSFKETVRNRLHAMMGVALRLRSSPYPFSGAPVALVIAPHPDDETLGCGGLIARKRLRADAVHVAFITDGGAAYPHHPTITPPILAARRESEAVEAARLLGLERTNLTFIAAADGTLGWLAAAAAAELSGKIAAVLDRIRPDEIFLPCRGDGSSEHEAAFTLARRAVAATGLHPRLFEYPIWARWNPRRLVRPLFASRRVWRVEPGSHRSAKARALAAYRSQVEPPLPWSDPMLSPQFLSCFSSGEEFFFET